MTSRATILTLQTGAVLVVLAALPQKLFELDRYFVAKELVLHAAALLLAILLCVRARTTLWDTADSLLGLFLAWSAISALFATNHWAAQRALAVSVSGAVIFWAARRAGASGTYRPVLLACAMATVLAAATSLAQAYGVESVYFSLNRAPGGTFGNRNFVAHICVIGLPSLVFCTVTARRAAGALVGSVSVALVAAALVLSRSRAAWLAIAVAIAALALPLIASRRYWTGGRVGGRFARLTIAAAVGAGLALFVPNQLNWNSESPYLDSALGMVDYKSGSGRGRVQQYTNSLHMAAANPVFGVGPGNWPVAYARFASDDDASFASDGMTANPWPSSDWVAFVSERGVVAAAALLAMLLALLIQGCRRWSELDGEAVLARVALAGTIPATLVVGAFDAALLLAAPALIAWSAIGAASGVCRAGRKITVSRPVWTTAMVLVIGLVAAGAVRSGGQAAAIESVGEGGSRAGWERASQWDHGSFRIALHMAQSYASRGRCAQSRVYARRALALFPNSPAARRAVRACN